MNWIYYLLEANLYLTVFYALYYLTLKNETYYQLNRAYLLFTSALAFLIPFLQLGILKPVYKAAVPVMIPMMRPITIKLMPPVKAAGWSATDYLLAAYIAICCVLAIHLAIKIYSLIRLSYKNKPVSNSSYKLVEMANGGNAFSFFNYLFISNDQPQKQTVINHELIHIQQKHSWDILYLQVFKIINWFNPIVYLQLHSIKEQHEFIADREAATMVGDASVYAGFLVINAYGINESMLTNTFFNKSLLKKRIIMLHQKPSGNLARLKYLAALPVCAGLLCASTLAFSKTYGWIDLAPKQKSDTTTSKKTEHNSEYVNVNDFTNAKGYKIAEKIGAHNGVWSRKVTITDKQGNLHVFYDEKITPADRKLLSETYGYQFPKTQVFNMKLIPPVPAVPPVHPIKGKSPSTPNSENTPSDNPEAQEAPLAPPAPPIGDNVHPIAPVPPKELTDNENRESVNKHQQYIISYENNTRVVGHAEEAQLIISQKEKPYPAIYVNGNKYDLKINLKSNEHLYITAADSAVIYTADDMYARQKYGDDARNGIIELHGKPSFTIR